MAFFDKKEPLTTLHDIAKHYKALHDIAIHSFSSIASQDNLLMTSSIHATPPSVISINS